MFINIYTREYMYIRDIIFNSREIKKNVAQNL